MPQSVTTNKQTLPEKLRKEHVPQVSDIYLHTSRGYESIIRLTEKKLNGKYVHFIYETWSFIDRCWNQCEFDTVSENELKENYYRYCLIPVDELIEKTERLFKGESLDRQAGDTTTEELILHGNELPGLLSQTEMLEDRMNTLATALNARMEEEKRLMESRMVPLKEIIKKTKDQIRKLHQAISIMDIYQGVNIKVMTLREGAPAPADTPVSIRQRILFMDEECAVLDEEGQGLDYWTRDRFYEWIKTPSHRDVILPEQKCVVVMKPRRFDKRYSSDPYEQRERNEWNRHSFILLRNGENISVVESDDLCIYDAAVPRKQDFERIESEMKNWHSNAEKELDNLNYRCYHLAMVLQGLCDRTEVFSPHGEVNFLKNTGSQIIFDDERNSLLGTGRQDFHSWLKEQSKTIRRGSRILYILGLSDGEPMRWELRGSSWNHYFPKISPPDTGLYTVEEKDNGKLGITYLPCDNWGERKRRETWLFERDTVINYDTVTPEVLEEYLKDRSQRKHYQRIIPLLRKLQLELSKEREYENLFVSALSRVLDERHIGHTPETLQNALKWWKNKVIHIRPIASDDDKAWRMIIGYIKKQNKSN